jgi:polyphosphate:AMP phosphotransferase
MFESAELGHRLGKAEYHKLVPTLRAALLNAQMRVVEAADFPVVLLSAGVDGGGRAEVVNLLVEWMDPRHISAVATDETTLDHGIPQPIWRHWQDLPPKGKLGVFFGSWYTPLIEDRVYRKIRDPELAVALDELVGFERMLVNEGALIVKVWMHLTKKAQRKRFETLEADKTTAWRVTKRDWEHHERYNRFRAVSERVLRETSTAEAPWTVVEATDARYRDVTVARALLDAMETRLGQRKVSIPRRAASLARPSIDSRNVIAELDRKKKLSDADYRERFSAAQARVAELSRSKHFHERGVAIVFEGNDAAGKGGAIRRVTSALDVRTYRVVPIAAPSEEERAQPYLWRFWRHVPRKGQFTIFDRSWYGRVLVERVEGFAAESDWMRAYREIVDFETSLIRSGIVVIKFWLAISKDEQLVRFRAREKTSFKRFKITEEDWRNRKKWDAYENAVCDMVDRTSTDLAPWTLVEANDKNWARVRVLETIGDAISKKI